MLDYIRPCRKDPHKRIISCDIHKTTTDDIPSLLKGKAKKVAAAMKNGKSPREDKEVIETIKVDGNVLL